jgi:dTDP-glucose 4,6-dehydratase
LPNTPSTGSSSPARQDAAGPRIGAASLRVLVTGGCGFIGSACVRRLIREHGAQVLNLDKLTYAGDPAPVGEVADDPRYAFRRIDVCDGESVFAQLRAFQPDRVIHLAAESHVDRSIDAPAAFVQTNVVGTAMMLEAALRYWQQLTVERRQRFRFLHVSTDEVYGTLPLGRGSFTEASAYAPNSPYAASKAAADHLARAWHRTYGLPVVVSNCCNNFGPFQFPEKLIPTVVIAALQGRTVPVYGEGANVRDWLHVDDHARALIAIAERGAPGATYLVGANTELSNLELVRSVCRILDEVAAGSEHRPHERLIEFVPDRPGHDLRYAIDATRLRTELGWAPQESFPAALRKTVQWYLDNRAWWGRIQRERYPGERLGLGVDRSPERAKAL